MGRTPSAVRGVLLAGALALSGPAAAQELPGLLSEPEAPAPSPPPGSIDAEATPADDRAIADRLRQIFSAVEDLESVRVEVRSGVVALSGEVLSSEAEERAERIARQLRGVVEVQSEIAVVRDVDRRLRPALQELRERGLALLGLLPLVAVALAVFLLFLGLGRVVTAWERPYRRLVRNGFARDLLQQAIRTVLVGVGVVLALQVVDATAVVATVAGVAGLAGLALSFAFRDIAENYIASVLLSLRQPFLPHDHVVIEGHEGRVVRLTPRATVLMNLAGNHVRIPNAAVFKSTILNYTRNPIRRFDFAVGVAPSTDLGDALALGIDTLSRMPGTVDEPRPQAWIDALGDWNVKLHFFAWIDQREVDWFRTRGEAIRLVKEAFDAACISMPEPTLQLMREPAAAGSARAAPPPEPVLEMDISPDPHLDRAVAQDRADAQEDLLDPAAPRE